jgi:5'-3' exonuclease
MKVLIDGDIVCFRCAFTAEEDPDWVASSRTDRLIDDILLETNSNDYEIWLSGPANFRYQVYPEYKANRLKAARPKWEKYVKEYMVDNWGAQWSQGCEADDMLGVRQCELGDNSSIIATIDKDLWQVPGKKYNFVKKEYSYVTPDQGLRYFYYQMLVGDSADNIKGAAGIGPKKAEAILRDCTTERDYIEAIRDRYSCDEELLMMGQVLWIWKKMNDIWRIPIDATVSQS